jgi:hypothetical protein
LAIEEKAEVITLPSSVQNLSLTFDSRSESLELVASSYNRQQFTPASSAPVRGVPPPLKSEAQPRKALDASVHAAGGDGARRSQKEPETDKLGSPRDCLPDSIQKHQQAKTDPQTMPADHDKGRPQFCERGVQMQVETRTVGVPDTSSDDDECISREKASTRLPSPVASIASAVSSWASSLAESWAKRCAPLFNPCSSSSEDEDDDEDDRVQQLPSAEKKSSDVAREVPTLAKPTIHPKKEVAAERTKPASRRNETEKFCPPHLDVNKDTADILDQMITDLLNKRKSNSLEKRKKVSSRFSSVSRRPSLSTISESAQSTVVYGAVQQRPSTGPEVNKSTPYSHLAVFEPTDVEDGESDTVLRGLRQSISSSAVCNSSSGYEEISTAASSSSTSEAVTVSTLYLNKKERLSGVLADVIPRVDMTERFSFLGEKEWDAFLMSENDEVRSSVAACDEFSTLTITASTAVMAKIDGSEDEKKQRRQVLPAHLTSKQAPEKQAQRKLKMADVKMSSSTATYSRPRVQNRAQPSPTWTKLDVEELKQVDDDQLADDKVAWLLAKLLRGVDLPSTATTSTTDSNRSQMDGTSTGELPMNKDPSSREADQKSSNKINNASDGVRARCDQQDKFDYVWHRLFHD